MVVVDVNPSAHELNTRQSVVDIQCNESWKDILALGLDEGGGEGLRGRGWYPSPMFWRIHASAIFPASLSSLSFSLFLSTLLPF